MSTVPVSATPPAPVASAPTHVSWLKHIGQILAKIGKSIVMVAQPVEKIAVPVLESMFPQFAPGIAKADSIFTNAVKQIIVTEAIGAAATTATSGPDKLKAVAAGIGPELDAWVQSAFPGAAKVAEAEKAGLAQAIVNIVNKIPASGVQLPPS